MTTPESAGDLSAVLSEIADPNDSASLRHPGTGLRHPRTGRPLTAEELRLVLQVANDPRLRAELETLHYLQKQCQTAIETMSTKRLKPHLKCDACTVLLDMTTFPGGISVIQQSGGTEQLCVLLRGGHSAEKKASSQVLARLAASEECRATIAEGGTVDYLIHMLRPDNISTDKEARSAAALTLANICSEPIYAQRVADLGAIKYLTRQLEAPWPPERTAAAVAIGNICVTPSLCRLVGAHRMDPISLLVAMLLRAFAESGRVLKREGESAALALRNLSAEDENKVRILEAGGITVALMVLATFEPSLQHSERGGEEGGEEDRETQDEETSADKQDEDPFITCNNASANLDAALEEEEEAAAAEEEAARKAALHAPLEGQVHQAPSDAAVGSREPAASFTEQDHFRTHEVTFQHTSAAAAQGPARPWKETAGGRVEGDWKERWRRSEEPVPLMPSSVNRVSDAIRERARLISLGSQYISLKPSSFLGGSGRLEVGPSCVSYFLFFYLFIYFIYFISYDKLCLP